jgi:hypothetical protein
MQNFIQLHVSFRQSLFQVRNPVSDNGLDFQSSLFEYDIGIG